MTTTPITAEMKLEWITARIAEGRTVYLTTATRVTKIGRRHLAQVRVRAGHLEVQYGRRWLNADWVKITAS